MKRAIPHRRARGYTLIEIVLAFAILALGLTLLLGTLSNATRQVRDAGDAGRAALHAQSLLADIGECPQEGGLEGELEDGRYLWRLDVQPWEGDPEPRDPALPRDPNGPQLMRLELEVAWGDEERDRLRLSSLRLLRPVPEGVEAP